MHSIVSPRKMTGKNVRIQPSLRILWKCSSSRHLKQMSMESDSASDAEETDKSNRDITVKMAKSPKKTIPGLNNDEGLSLKPNTLWKHFEHQKTAPSNIEIASLESNSRGKSKINSLVKDTSKQKIDGAGSSLHKSEDVSSVSRTKKRKDNENGDSSDAPKISTDAAGDETNSKLHHSNKASTLNALEFFSGHNRVSANKKHTIFTKIPHITQQSDVISPGKDMSENSSDKASPTCQHKAEAPASTENKRPSSKGEAFTRISQEMEGNKKPHSEVKTPEPDIQELPCKAGTSDQQQIFERRASFSTCRTGSSVTLEFPKMSRSRVLNPRMKRPDVPKACIDRGVQVCRTECGKSPTRLESKVNILESRIRLEELRSRHWISRVITAEKSLLKLCEQLQALDKAMRTISSSPVLQQGTKSISGLDKNDSPQVYENIIQEMRDKLDNLDVTSAINKNTTAEENLPVNNTPR